MASPAQAMAGDRAYATALERAIHGVAVPRFYRGQQVGIVHRPDYRLALKVLDWQLARPVPDFHEAMAALTDIPAGDE